MVANSLHCCTFSLNWLPLRRWCWSEHWRAMRFVRKTVQKSLISRLRSEEIGRLNAIGVVSHGKIGARYSNYSLYFEPETIGSALPER